MPKRFICFLADYSGADLREALLRWRRGCFGRQDVWGAEPLRSASADWAEIRFYRATLPWAPWSSVLLLEASGGQRDENRSFTNSRRTRAVRVQESA